MKGGFYVKLAWTGVRKNKRLYLPYILTCTGMVMMFYIVSFLSGSNVLRGIPGGDTVQAMLGLGCSVIGVFALIFLFYTNSFLMRRRKKEFGLYNILGMGKWNLARVLFWESLLIAHIALAGGLAAGMLLSKFAELGMVNLLAADVTFSLTVEPKAVLATIGLYAAIFGLIFLNALRQIHLTNPINLLHSENAGEKPPKANWILALAGALLLAGAYYLAVSIEDPVSALIWFFAAVILVVIATYLLFVAGSVAICRVLQKKKRYYYKTNHFVSISSMVYRMKRNGAGLASICILCTMVLVMLSTTVCLYIGVEDGLRTRYPRNINLDATISDLPELKAEKMQPVRDTVAQTAGNFGLEPENVLDYRMAAFAGPVKDGRIYTDDTSFYAFQLNALGDYYQIFIVPLEDYNRLMGQNETLQPGEALIYTTKTMVYDGNTIAINDAAPLSIKKVIPDFADNGVDAMQIVPSLYVFVPNFEEVVEPLLGLKTDRGDNVAELHWIYSFDLNCDDGTQIQMQDQLMERFEQLSVPGSNQGYSVLCEGVAKERSGFYGLYGGALFPGDPFGRGVPVRRGFNYVLQTDFRRI